MPDFMSILNRMLAGADGELSVDDRAKRERANRAVRRFNKMLPGLTNFARAMSGNPKLRITLSTRGASSTKDEIWFYPPLALGDDHPHYRCGQYDKIGYSLCEACAIADEIQSGIMHELGHITQGSFDRLPLYYGAHRRMYREWLEATKGFTWKASVVRFDYEAAVEKQLAAMTDPTAPLVASFLHPYLPILNNALEDDRVNRRIYEIRPGIETISLNRYRMYVYSGVQNNETGEFIQYRDMHANSQMMVSIVMTLYGIECDGYIDEQVIEHLQDETIQEILKRPRIDTVDTLGDAIDLLVELNRLGYFIANPPKENEPPDTDSESGASGESGDGSGSGEGSSGSAAEAQMRDERPGEDPSAVSTCASEDVCPEDMAHRHQPKDENHAEETDGHEPTPVLKAQRTDATPMDVSITEDAINQAAWFETGSVDVRGVQIHEFNGHRSYWTEKRARYRTADSFKVESVTLNNPTMKLRALLERSRRTVVERNLRKGRLSSGHLAKRVPFGDDRIFKRKSIPGKQDYEVILMMDCSGSTRGYNSEIERDVVYAMAEMLHRIGVTFSIYGHTSHASYMVILPVKPADSPWDANCKHGLANIDGYAGNLDGHALEFARKRADESTATNKIIMYASDGAMPAENHVEEKEILVREVNECKRRGYTLIGLGIRSDSPTQYGLDTVLLESGDEIGLAVEFLAKYIKVG